MASEFVQKSKGRRSRKSGRKNRASIRRERRLDICEIVEVIGVRLCDKSNGSVEKKARDRFIIRVV